MKTKHVSFPFLAGCVAAIGISMGSAGLLAEEADKKAPPASGDAPAQAAESGPDFEKIRGMVREMVELKKAGKNEQAAQLAEQIKKASGDDPRVAELLKRQGERKPNLREAKRPRPEGNPPDDAAGARQGVDAESRIQHLQQAAMHLEAAGDMALARVVRSQLAVRQRGGKEPGVPMGPDGVDGNPQPPGVRPNVRPDVPGPGGQRWMGRGDFRPQGPSDGNPPLANEAIQREIRELRSEMQEIRKLREEIEEIRKQLRAQ